MAWDRVKQADRDHTDAIGALETAQAATATAEAALTDAQAAYDAAKAAEAEAERAAEVAQALLVEVSAEVGIDYPPEEPPAPAAARSRRK